MSLSVRSSCGRFPFGSCLLLDDFFWNRSATFEEKCQEHKTVQIECLQKVKCGTGAVRRWMQTEESLNQENRLLAGNLSAQDPSIPIQARNSRANFHRSLRTSSIVLEARDPVEG